MSEPARDADSAFEARVRPLVESDILLAAREAEAECRRRPDDLGPWRMLAYVHHRQRDLRGASDALRRLLQLRPEDHGALFNLAICENRLGRTEKALALFERAPLRCERSAGGW
ncbi:MAG: tetratricopeptide repeat protein [Alphaproteobacteria bacterium]|nr:tetratricopeptide repeat protein [Alphaproteobacteria bacterium]